ncbi:unnamed protein product [Macrosiphum euphorbiae]|uniref:Uncharacterized protein n=1 Tax=Macrosiphum euphorbiae TaxID=13131 RepID=A0AAV0WUA3_9HEMI|nr:unnamed protein product [Macrosiphum euphorbiae]
METKKNPKGILLYILAIHGHDTVTESTCTVAFLNDNTDNVLATANELDTEELVLVNMHAEEDSNNLDVITISVNSNNSNEQDSTEKANESDPFDQFTGTVKKRSLDKPFEEELQNAHNQYTTYSPHLVIIHLISYSSIMINFLRGHHLHMCCLRPTNIIQHHKCYVHTNPYYSVIFKIRAN